MADLKSSTEAEKSQSQRDEDTLRRAVTNFDSLLALIDSLPRPEQTRGLALMLARLAEKLERVSLLIAEEKRGRPEKKP